MKRMITIVSSEQTDWKFDARELTRVGDRSVWEAKEPGTGRQYRFVVQTGARTPRTLGAECPPSERGCLIACLPEDWSALWQNLKKSNGIDPDGERLPSLDLDLDLMETVLRELSP